MRMLKLLLCGLLLAMPVLANETEDRQTATSLKYVTHELDTRQDKLSAGANKAIEYTDSAGGAVQRTVEANLNGADTSLPTVSAVTGGLNTKQNTIAPINDHTAVTYTGTTGGIGTKGIYQTTGTYAEQSDNLIDAKTFNAALKTGLDSEFVCDEDNRSPDGDCWLYKIHNTTIAPYVSATGTVAQNGTPTPTNPIYPTFYHQGNMILRRVGDYTDSYDATTHKITRRVGEMVFDGTENWRATANANKFYLNPAPAYSKTDATGVCTHYLVQTTSQGSAGITLDKFGIYIGGLSTSTYEWYITDSSFAVVTDLKQYLAEQYAAGTPVTVYYPLATPTEEDWTQTTYNGNIYIPQNQ